MLTDRQKNILFFLSRKDGYTTINSLAQKFEMSERSIRYDLKSLSTFLKRLSINLETLPRLGSRLIIDNTEKREQIELILSDSNAINFSSEERIVAICQKLMLSDKTTVDMLANELFVSRNTILADLKSVKEMLSLYEIELMSKSYDGVSINAKELDIRTAFMKIYIKSLPNKITTDLIAEYFEILEIFIETLQDELNVEYSENSSNELLTLIALVLKRCTLNKHITISPPEIIDKKNADYKVLENILKDKFESYLFTDGDILFITKWLKSTKVLSDYSNSEISKFNDVSLKLISDMECHLKMKFSDDSDFVNSLSMHLNVAIYRLKNNFVIVNPLEEEIKYSIGFICDLIKKSLKSYERELGVTFPSSEIAFLAMHFGAAYENTFNRMFIPKVLIVCNTGLSTSILLKSRLQIAFPRLEIVSTCKLSKLTEELSLHNIDLVISTVPITECNAKYVIVNPLLDYKDSSAISDMLSNVSTEKSYKYLADISNSEKSKLGDLIPMKYSIFESDATNYKDALNICASPLIDDRKIIDKYVSDIILATETLGSYMVIMPEIAFAHAKNTNVFENTIGIINLKESILFGDSKKVKTIILLANKTENDNLIKLINILQKDSNAKMLKNAKCYDDIKNLTT